MRQRYPNKKKILLVNITRLGDMIQATPTIAGLKKENPDCHISVLVEKGFAEVCNYIPHIDQVIPLDLPMMVTAIAREGDGIVDAYDYLDRVVKALRDQQFDYCVNMSNSAYTALLLRMVKVDRLGGWVSDPEGFRLIESNWARLFCTNVYHRNRFFNSLNLVDIFRCSADVVKHPQTLLLNIPNDAQAYASELLSKQPGKGPRIAIQVGASQQKRQWAPSHFAELLKLLVERLDANLVLTGTKKELEIINQVTDIYNSDRILIAAGQTNIPQLAGVLKDCDVTITGDTGTMHVSVAVSTPVVAMFLASAYGFETGPYSAGNIVVQPSIACGPCNPNKLCSRPDCHDLVSPELMFQLVARQINPDGFDVSAEFFNPSEFVVYESSFDEHGFIELLPIHSIPRRINWVMKEVYRRLWLDDLGDLVYTDLSLRPKFSKPSSLIVVDENEEGRFFEGISWLLDLTRRGKANLERLEVAVSDDSSLPGELSSLSDAISAIEQQIEDLGYQISLFGPVTRMFTIDKENLIGTEPLHLASQMRDVFSTLERRVIKLKDYYNEVHANSSTSVHTETNISQSSKLARDGDRCHVAS